MTQVAILTDSTASIPEDMLEQLDIHTVAFYIHRGQEVLRDLITIQRDEFLNWLKTASYLPKTASPGPGDYFTAYQALVEKGHDEILSIQMTSKGSGAFQAASVAKSMLTEKNKDVHIELIDTGNVSLCQGWMAIEAARAALTGMKLEKIVAMVRRMLPTTRMIQTADTLRYLYLGGRIGKAKHVVGSLLNLKPLISMEEGEIVLLGIARSLKNAYKAMAEKIFEKVNKQAIKVAYVHAGARQEAEKLKQVIEVSLHVVEAFIAELSPALMVHSGPGTIGLCYCMAES